MIAGGGELLFAMTCLYNPNFATVQVFQHRERINLLDPTKLEPEDLLASESVPQHLFYTWGRRKKTKTSYMLSLSLKGGECVG